LEEQVKLYETRREAEQQTKLNRLQEPLLIDPSTRPQNPNRNIIREENIAAIGRRETQRFWTQKYVDEVKDTTRAAIRKKATNYVRLVLKP
jgi:hypothetical protein